MANCHPKIFIVIGSFLLFVPFVSFGAEAVKLKHVLSLSADKNGVPFQQPEGIACDKKLLVVADTGNARLLRYNVADGNVSDEKEIKLPEMISPVRIQITSRGGILALDTKTRRILRISPDGAFNGYVEPKGLPAARAVVPKSFRLDRGDNIYILDILDGCVLVLNSDGQYQKQIDFPKGFGFFSDLAVDNSGMILLIDSVNAMVYSSSQDLKSFSPLSKSLKGKMDFPTSIATDAKGLIYIADQNGGRIIVLQQDGSFLTSELAMGWDDGFLRYPSALCLNSEGTLFVADRSNNRVQLFAIVK